MNNNPPKWALRFLHWYCHPDLLEEIEGDIYELFDRRIKTSSIAKAKRRFVWDIIRFCRWSNIKKSNSNSYQSNPLAMLKNYFKIGFRNMARYWVTSSVNIGGLALALGCLITLFLFIDMQRSLDNYHSNANNIYQIVNHVNTGENLDRWGDSPIALGPAMKSDLSQVADIFRIEFQSANVKYGNKVFNESIVFADPALLSALDFPLLNGNSEALKNRQQLVISYNMAEKYFDHEEPVGQTLTLSFGNGIVRSYTVGTVLEKYPYNSSIRFNFILPIDNFMTLGLRDNLDWSYFTDATFAVLQDQTDPQLIEDQMNQYVSVQNSFDPEWQIERFELVSLETVAQQGYEIRGAIMGGSHPAGQVALGIVAILLTILACFNYMNISIAASTKRLKEIALRKVVGGNRMSIVIQFLVENLIQISLALLFGSLLGYFFFMPGLNSMLPFTVPFHFSSLPATIGFYLGVLILVGLISSLYPALYVSRFQPVAIFKGTTRFGSKSLFSKVLLVFQLILAFVTVVGCFIFTDNAIHYKNSSIGYDPEGILVLELDEPETFTEIENFAKNSPLVDQVIGTQGHVCESFDIIPVKHLDVDVRTLVMSVHPEYTELMKIEVVEGNKLNPNLTSEENNEILVNQRFVEKMHWSTAIGQELTIDGAKYQVVGMVKDFQYSIYFAYEKMLPVVLKVSPKSTYQYAVFKTTPGNIAALDVSLKTKWQELVPNDPYNSIVQANAFDPLYQELDGNIIIILIISVIAVILACMGLFGLITFNIQSRVKEFSMRKILGADVPHIIGIAAKQYIWIIFISFFIGGPLGYLLIDTMIQSVYFNPKETGSLPFILSILIMLVTLTATIIGQLRKAINVNPVENLRSE
ncbi:MAG: ABC transporter permease [Cyclobacteriaceae bacterium]